MTAIVKDGLHGVTPCPVTEQDRGDTKVLRHWTLDGRLLSRAATERTGRSSTRLSRPPPLSGYKRGVRRKKNLLAREGVE